MIGQGVGAEEGFGSSLRYWMVFPFDAAEVEVEGDHLLKKRIQSDFVLES